MLNVLKRVAGCSIRCVLALTSFIQFCQSAPVDVENKVPLGYSVRRIGADMEQVTRACVLSQPGIIRLAVAEAIGDQVATEIPSRS